MVEARDGGILVGRQEIRRRRRKRREEAVAELLMSEEEVDSVGTEALATDADSLATAGPSRPGGWLKATGLLLMLAAVGIAVVPGMVEKSDGETIRSTLGEIGVHPGTVFLLGVVLVLGAVISRRIARIEGEAGQEMMEGLMGMSERLQSVFEGIEGFRDRLEAIKSDRVAATLNQVRYEVSSLHEKVHRELIPASDLRERFDHLEEKVASSPTPTIPDADSDEMKEFCSSMEEAVKKLNPDLESIREAVESGATTAGRGLENIAGLVEKLEREIRDLDEKANRILSLSSEVQEKVDVLGDEGSVQTGPTASASSNPDGGEESADSSENEPLAAGAGASSEGGADARPARGERDTTFRSAIERLKNLRT
jgi:predicted nuclease with TOPRIM domain